MINPVQSKNIAPRGFNLFEVFAALGVVGTILMLMVPTIINTVRDHQKITTFQEGFQTLDTLINATNTVGLNKSNQLGYIYDHMNTIHSCKTSGRAQGCWVEDMRMSGGKFVNPHNMTPPAASIRTNMAAPNEYYNEAKEPGYVLANGLVIVGLTNIGWTTNPSIDTGNGIWMDYNGSEGPNKMGEDQVNLFYCIKGKQPGGDCTNASVGNSVTQPQGSVTHYDNAFVGPDAAEYIAKNTQLVDKILGLKE